MIDRVASWCTACYKATDLGLSDPPQAKDSQTTVWPMVKSFSQQSAKALVEGLQRVVTDQLDRLGGLQHRLHGPLTTNDATQLVNDICQLARAFAANAYSAKLYHDWSVPPTPEWHDHFIDLYRALPIDRNTLWVERGVYGVAALKRGGRFLELCCGDGFNTRHFYSPFASAITAIDFDEGAIAHARTYNAHPTVSYVLGDIRQFDVSATYSNVIWDAAIEHFTETEIASIMKRIKEVLDPSGVLSGYTIVEKEGGKHLHQHEREFRSMADLANFLTPHFKNVRVFETIHSSRHNLYFYASDSVVPFDEGHSSSLVIRSS